MDMKINKGKDINAVSSLVIANMNGNEPDLILLDGISYIRVITDGTKYDKIIEGIFEYSSFNKVGIDDYSYIIPLEYIEEIEILN